MISKDLGDKKVPPEETRKEQLKEGKMKRRKYSKESDRVLLRD